MEPSKKRIIMDESQQDPSTSESLSRKLRLKQILDRTHELENDLPQQQTRTLDIISALIRESDNIINEGDAKDRVEHTTEVVMDTHVLKMNHELVSKIIKQNLEFSDQMYQNAINSIVDTGPTANWDALADIVYNVPHTVNVHSTMLGAIEVELKQRVVKERQQRQHKTLAAEKRPETVSKIKRQDKGAEKMNIVHKQLAEIFKANNCRAIPFFKLIVDPKNFMNSVENAFQLSFLARDGAIGLDIGVDGHPEIRLVQSAEQKILLDTAQWICSLDEKKCKKMAEFYKIKHPMLKIELENDDEDMICEEEYLDSD